MLGFADFWIALAYILTILSAIGCLVYGIIYWNKGDDDTTVQMEEKKWAKEEDKVEANL